MAQAEPKPGDKSLKVEQQAWSSEQQLTRFKPLSPDLKNQNPFSFVNLFKKKEEQQPQLVTQTKKESREVQLHNVVSGSEDEPSPDTKRKSQSHPLSPTQQDIPTRPKQLHFDTSGYDRKRTSSSESQGETPRGPNRTLSTVLKRLSNLVDGRSQVYRDIDFKQYWMPDSNCKECYDCGDKFTTFRRRHHCRVCGQIFCSRCCNQEVPGKFMGYSGNLRVCTYCCKVVLSYAQSADGTLKALQEDLSCVEDMSTDPAFTPSLRKRGTLFKEEDFTRTRTHSSASLDSPSGGPNPFEIAITPMIDYQRKHTVTAEAERKLLIQDSAQLREIWLQIQHPHNGIQFQNHRYRLRTYIECIVGSELVDWLIHSDKAANRYQGIAIGQALVDAMLLESVLGTDRIFRDEYALYRPGKTAREELENYSVSDDDTVSIEDYWEPTWFKEIDLQEKGNSSEDDEADEGSMRARLGSDSSTTTKESETSQFSLDVQQATVNYRPKKSTSRHIRDNKRDSGGSWDIYFQQDSSVSTSMGDDLKGALSVVTVAEAKKTPQGWHCMEHLREDSGERLAMERLSTAHYSHLVALLTQQLNAEGLCLSWADIVLPLVRKISELVKPDVRHDDDDMDIRQYVQFKKVPGGQKTDSCMVNGVVCTKNVAHKKMRTHIINPKILLLTAAIEYQRVENKMSSLDPLVLQEHEYLKNCIAKIANVQPEILLVEKSVARLAQDFLHHAGITLVLNVKPQVMQRVARMTQADLTPSIEQVTKPRLGFCHSFRLQSFKMEDGCTKTLMFFEGCATHLGCSVILRGGSRTELAKVKKVMQFVLFAACNSRLEISYLMDEHSMPPPPPQSDRESVDDSNSDGNLNSPVSGELDEIFDMTDGVLSKHSSLENVLNVDMRNESGASSSEELVTDFNITKKDKVNSDVVLHTKDKVDKNIRKDDARRDFDVDDGLESHMFGKALENKVHLSSSPYLTYKVPYLITPHGRKCPVRQFFPDQIYWSAKFEEQDSTENSTPNGITVMSPHDNALYKDYGVYFGHKYNPTNVKIDQSHKFVVESLTCPVTDDNTKSLMADFRARGGRMKLYQFERDNRNKTDEEDNLDENKNEVDGDTAESDSYYPRKMDCLDPYFHQHIVVLFGSHSSKSRNAPNYCIPPWVVSMDFCGRNDITLGAFLERYCFRPSYMCPNPNCDTPMVDHIRRFSHGNGSIQIVLRSLETPIPGYQDSVLMWSWCRKCKQVTPVVPLTQDSWSLSFAKYLELRFYGDKYGRRACLDPCPHSLHHDHYQYFGLQNMVASFKYSRISLFEIALPPIIVSYSQTFKCWKAYYREVKHLAFNGHKVYSDILERIMTLKSESGSTSRDRRLKDFITQQTLDQTHFREMIDKLQTSLTTGELEYYAKDKEQQLRDDYPTEIHSVIHKLLDDVFHVKKLICEDIALWNDRLYDLEQQERSAKKHKSSNAGKNEDGTDGQTTDIPVTIVVTEEMSSSTQTIDAGTTVNMPSITDEATRQNSSTLTDDISTTSTSVMADATNETIATTDEESDVQQEESVNSSTRPVLQRASTWGPQASSQQVPIRGRISSIGAPVEYGVSPGIQAVLHNNPRQTRREQTIKLTSQPEEISEPASVPDKTPKLPDLSEYDICEVPGSNGKSSRQLYEAVERSVSDKPGHRRVRSLDGKHNFTKSSSSDFTEAITNSDDSTSSKQSDKKGAIMKTLFQNLLSGPMFTPLTGPYSLDEHYMLPPFKIPVVVIDTEPSSIIAYALSCKTYDQKLGEFKQTLKVFKELTTTSTTSSTNSSPQQRLKSEKPSILKNTEELEKSITQKPVTDLEYNRKLQNSHEKGNRGNKVLAFLKGSLSKSELPHFSKAKNTVSTDSNQLKGADRVYYRVDDEVDSPSDDGKDSNKDKKDETDFSLFRREEKSRHHPPNPHIELQFSDNTAKYYCRVYFAEQFRLLRKTIFPAGEEAYIRSLSHCIQWIARGGKSGSTFLKTSDDRFILKQMSRLEVQSFSEFAPHYFQYVQISSEDKKPIALAKILGVYRVGFRNSQTNNTMKQDLLVMENLFYGRKMAQVFDLKGSVRNRHVKVSGEETEDLVLLDENLLKYIMDYPLYIRTHSKTALTVAIYNDTLFLSGRLVMDYSLLVGIDTSKRELVVGIIDYIRTFTWDKKLEMVVKSSGILGGQGKMPTVVSPELYRTRFLEAMGKYFLMVPDRWTGLGRDVDC
ncbi:1-phosphatidylinositol 3-phosphate 5-kinase-like [Glandiceps talaboti]